MIGKTGNRDRRICITRNFRDEMMMTKHLKKYLLLLVRSSDDVARACREAEDYLRFQRARIPADHEAHDLALIGIWIDSFSVDSSPSNMFGRAQIAELFRVSESVELSEIWSLCWLDVEFEGETVNRCTIRKLLVTDLIENRPPAEHQYTATQKFVPIFDVDDDRSFIQLQTRQLRELFPNRIDEPMMWSRTTGVLNNAPQSWR